MARRRQWDFSWRDLEETPYAHIQGLRHRDVTAAIGLRRVFHRQRAIRRRHGTNAGEELLDLIEDRILVPRYGK